MVGGGSAGLVAVEYSRKIDPGKKAGGRALRIPFDAGELAGEERRRPRRAMTRCDESAAGELMYEFR